MKNQALFSWKDRSKKLKCRLLQFLFGALRIKAYFWTYNIILVISIPVVSKYYHLKVNILGQEKLH